MAKQPSDPQPSYEMLADLVRRIETEEAGKVAIAEGIREIYAEAKAAGFNTKVIRKVIMKRRQDPSEQRDLEEYMNLYEKALERAGTNQPVGRRKADPLEG